MAKTQYRPKMWSNPSPIRKQTHECYKEISRKGRRDIDYLVDMMIDNFEQNSSTGELTPAAALEIIGALIINGYL